MAWHGLRSGSKNRGGARMIDPFDCYKGNRYVAEVLEVHDGDSLTARVDLGLRITLKAPLRIAGIDAYELKTLEGKKAKAFAQLAMPAGSKVLVSFPEKAGLDKYGRLLAKVWLKDAKDPENLIYYANQIVTAGLAVAYDGGKKTLPQVDPKP